MRGMRKYTGWRYTLPVSGKIKLFLEGSYCFWKDTTVSGRTKLFLEGYNCLWKDTTVSGRITFFWKFKEACGRINILHTSLI